MKKHLIISILLFTFGIAQANAQLKSTSNNTQTEKSVKENDKT